MSSHDVPYPPVETPYRPDSIELRAEVFRLRQRPRQTSGTMRQTDEPPAAPALGREHDAEAESGTR